MLYENLAKLSALPGVSGCEEPVRYEILKMIEGHCIYKVDALGNILAFKKGRQAPAHPLLFSAHMDEVGLIITWVEESGLLKFTTVGGIDRRVLPGKSVAHRGDLWRDRLQGGAHEVRRRAGQGPRARRALHRHWREGPRRRVYPCRTGGPRGLHLPIHRLRGRLPARAGARRPGRLRAARRADWVGACLRHPLRLHRAGGDGYDGARTAAYQAGAEIAVAVETTTACDIPGTPPEKVVCSLKKGPVLSFMDKGTVYDMDLYRRALAAAKAGGIACQPKEGVYGGNEARSVQVAGRGARVLAVSVPCRYLHTPSCVVNRFDLDETLRLLGALIADFGG